MFVLFTLYYSMFNVSFVVFLYVSCWWSADQRIVDKAESVLSLRVVLLLAILHTCEASETITVS